MDQALDLSLSRKERLNLKLTKPLAYDYVQIKQEVSDYDIVQPPKEAPNKLPTRLLPLPQDWTFRGNSDYSKEIKSDSWLHMQSSLSLNNSEEDIKVSLDAPELWDAFRECGTEMIINRNGRRMFPHLDVIIQGLKPTQLYNILLEVCPYDDHRYKFINNKWVAMGAADPLQPNNPVLHHDSPNVGSFWMKKLSFAKVKLTNCKDSKDGNIFLQSMHRYKLRVIIELAGSDGNSIKDNIINIPMDETSFYAVTAYQNEAIVKLKVQNNPFAKAFRDHRTVSRTRRVRTARIENMIDALGVKHNDDSDQHISKRIRTNTFSSESSSSSSSYLSSSSSHSSYLSSSPPSSMSSSSSSSRSPPMMSFFSPGRPVGGMLPETTKPHIPQYMKFDGYNRHIHPYMGFGGMHSFPFPTFLPSMVYPVANEYRSEHSVQN